MKNITITVPDDKYDEYLAKIKSLDLPNVAINEDFDIPEWHKEVVLERINNAKDEDWENWDDIKDSFLK